MATIKTLTMLGSFSLLLSSYALADVVVGWNGAGANDTTLWGQLGADSTVIANNVNATSTAGNHVNVNFAGGSGRNSVECPAAPSCSWTGGFGAGDHLIWTTTSTVSPSNTGPLTLTFTNLVSAAGLEIQADNPGAFQAIATVTLADLTQHTVSANSDAAGDVLFIGLQDQTAADIKSIEFNVIQGNNTDFAVDTLDTINPSQVPEPKFGFLLVAGLPLLGLAVRRLRRFAQQ